MLVLGIESTCDETACAVVRKGDEILSNVISSQIDLHAAYGGVVPELACRRHIDLIIPVIQQALDEAKINFEDVDLFAASQGPGLVGAIMIGFNTARALSLALGKPFIGINHVDAHLYAPLMHTKNLHFPCLGVVLSGGHTSLINMKSLFSYETISGTVDDAIGEAFDKTAKILSLPYPGGPQIEMLAKQGNRLAYQFRAGRVKGAPLHFSFSGLKTAVLYAIKDKELSFEEKCDVAASFQHAAFQDVIDKTVLAAKQYNCSRIVFGGGVTNNQHLRRMFSEQAGHLEHYWPSVGLSLDNAAMIAGLAYHQYKHRGGDTLDKEVFTFI